MRGILDTSVFVAREQARPLADLPDQAAISVVTLAELHLGVLVADGPGVRARRLRTVTEVERTFDALPIDDAVARAFAEIVSEARRNNLRPKIMDSFIAATAVTHGVPVFTQDADFDAIPQVEVVRV